MSATTAGHLLYQTDNCTPHVPLALSAQTCSPPILKQIRVLQLPRPKSCHSWSVPTLLRATLALPRCTTCFPALGALTATLNINWGSGQPKVGARSLECNPGGISPCLLESSSALLSWECSPCSWLPMGRGILYPAHSILTENQCFPAVIGINNTNREGEPQNNWPCFALQPQVCYSHSVGRTRKFVKVLDISWKTQCCPWCSLRHRTLGQGPANLQAWSQLIPKNAPTGHMYNAITLWRKWVFLLRILFHALELQHANPCEYPSLWIANKIGENKTNF